MRRAAVLLVGCALAWAAAVAAGQGQSCTVDDAGTGGDCRQIGRCPELLRIAQTAVPNTPEVQRLRELVRKCPRSADGGFLICCQNEPTRTRVRLPANNECGLQFTPKVISGENAGVAEFPWMASIQYRKTPNGPLEHGCGGTLITSRHVLTAAHCVSFLSTPEFPDLTPVSVILGELDFNSEIDCDRTQSPPVCGDPPVSVAIKSIFPHPDFFNIRRLALPNDIAVVKLARDVTFTNFIRPICLLTDLSVMPAGRTDLTAGRNAQVAGWGRSDIASGVFTPFLQKATLPIQNLSECESVFNLTLSGRICAGGGADDSDTCRGDSGGPLMIPLRFGTAIYQTGISSFGAKVCGNVAGYTRIFHHRKWIVEQLNK